MKQCCTPSLVILAASVFLRYCLENKQKIAVKTLHMRLPLAWITSKTLLVDYYDKSLLRMVKVWGNVSLQWR